MRINDQVDVETLGRGGIAPLLVPMLVLSINEPYLEDTCEGEGIRAEIVFGFDDVRRLREACDAYLRGRPDPEERCEVCGDRLTFNELAVGGFKCEDCRVEEQIEDLNHG